MSYTSYADMGKLIKACVPFEGNSARGVWEGEVYKVYSYRTVIATVSGSYAGREGRGEVEIDLQKYSVTTSRLQNIIKRAYGVK